ncbi:lysosome-associated membrane glycoprotein 2 isoform X2 [Hyla sarda]|uniref:lysosome-associated membrane glycoprotein 2 isoform X2 n=1 Tax=Hyla sarda TaxID=327740 RepID=UPI0024C363D8|nr:lysosome-associated membrane glycoprotein 2 isoform X2 [Hyla sarda]XP_056396012.1 lysosome-associated membrane glycoprotein 2 isoform X2 [Hyla sarda]
MERYLCGLIIYLLGLGLMSSEAFEVEVKDESKTCIHANLKVKFIIQYETINNTLKNTTLVAPDAVDTSGSTCGSTKEAPLLVVNFGNNHTWSVNFTKNSTVYSIDVIVFTYNTNDSALFPDAKIKGVFNTVRSIGESVPINETYICLHEEVLSTENVTQVYWNVSLLAYAQDVSLTKEFHCSGDTTPTKAPPTSVVPTANTTSAAPKPTPKPEDKPSTGNYSVLNGTEKCLLASMGLQLNTTLLVDGKNVRTTFNIDPNRTISSGDCGVNTAILRLNDSGIAIVELYFSIKLENFYLKEVNVTIRNATEMSRRTSTNLSLWEASVGNSYLCHKEQLIRVSEDLIINTFDVRVQPFNVQNGTYATASECFIDNDSILIPIIVGAALAGLIVIIVIAYLIGRRKTYAGYQTL